MTLAWSYHQYAELVRNQKVETWRACHRHAFEWFNGVPGHWIPDYVAGHIIYDEESGHRHQVCE